MTMVMVDIETQATRHDARIISIGACAVSNLYTEPTDWPTFLVSIPEDKSDKYYVDPDTLKWWSKQGEAAQEALQVNPASDTGDALMEFNMWLESVGFAVDKSYNGMTNTIWANPPQFDLTILDHAYRAEVIPKPWHYRQERCSRTVWAGRDRRTVVPLTPPRNLVKHRADDDAIKQMCGLVGIKRYEERLHDMRDTIADVLNLS